MFYLSFTESPLFFVPNRPPEPTRILREQSTIGTTYSIMVLPRIIRFSRPLFKPCIVGCLFGVASSRLDNAYRINNAYRLYRRLSWRALLPHCRALGYMAFIIFVSVQAYWLLSSHFQGSLGISDPRADKPDTQLNERTSSHTSHHSTRTSSPVSRMPYGAKQGLHSVFMSKSAQ